eukprot:scaffold134538_cov38-Cyclotella_meneghiniana.AAC.1
MLFIKAALAAVTTTFTAGVVNAASAGFHSIDYNWGDNTVSRADVLLEYGNDINNAPLDVLIAHEEGSDVALLHLNANDYVASCSYADAQTMAFNITGHLVAEDSHIIQITCPACAEDGCDGAICTLDYLEDEADQFHLRGVALSDEKTSLKVGCFNGRDCFSLESTVFVKDKGAISIKDLRIGDMVLSDDQGGYTKYYSRGHYLEQARAEFLRIYTESQVNPLELTPAHMIFREADALPVPAHSIKVGDVVKTIDGPSKVIDVRKISRKGIFNPLTVSGAIVVDGIVSSTHTTHPGFEGTDAGWLYLADHKLIHWHTLVHVALAPHRIICGRFMHCDETLNEEGLTPYTGYLKKYHDVAEEKQSTILTFCLFLILVAQSAIFLLLEILFQHATVCVSATCVFLIGRKCLFSKDCNKEKAL